MRNSEMTDDRIESLIRDAADAFRPSADVKEAARTRLMGSRGEESELVAPNEVTESQSPAARSAGGGIRFSLMWRLASAASFLIILGAIGAYVLWPSQLTLAQVQAALDDVEWVHVVYDNGDERWWNTQQRLSGNIDSSGFRFVDYTAQRVWSYHPSVTQPQWIYEHETQALLSGDTAWEIIVGFREERVGHGARGGLWTEMQPEVVEGRPTIRFDTYRRDALGEPVRFEQIWADPAARLPIKVRRKACRSESRDREFVTGRFSFPKSGPQSIYDLGVDPSVPIAVLPEGETTPEAVELFTRIEQAAIDFPSTYRQVVWSNYDPFIAVRYWDGEVSRRSRRPWLQAPDARRRQDRYVETVEQFKAFEQETFKGSTRDLLEWTASQTPTSVRVDDSEREYSQSAPRSESGAIPASLDRGFDGMTGFGRDFAIARFWMPTSLKGAKGGTLSVIRDGEAVPKGQVLLRWVNGPGRTDYYIDPARDFMCMREVGWDRTHDGQWIRASETWLEDFTQLPTGHWYPQRIRWWQRPYPNGPEREMRIEYLSIEILDESELPDDVFNIDKLMEDARKMGATIKVY